MHKVVFTLLVFTVLTVFGQQQGEACEGKKMEKDFLLFFFLLIFSLLLGVKIIYPKSSSVIKRNEEIYIILGK